MGSWSYYGIGFEVSPYSRYTQQIRQLMECCVSGKDSYEGRHEHTIMDSADYSRFWRSRATEEREAEQFFFLCNLLFDDTTVYGEFARGTTITDYDEEDLLIFDPGSMTTTHRYHIRCTGYPDDVEVPGFEKDESGRYDWDDPEFRIAYEKACNQTDDPQPLEIDRDADLIDRDFIDKVISAAEEKNYTGLADILRDRTQEEKITAYRDLILEEHPECLAETISLSLDSVLDSIPEELLQKAISALPEELRKQVPGDELRAFAASLLLKALLSSDED